VDHIEVISRRVPAAVVGTTITSEKLVCRQRFEIETSRIRPRQANRSTATLCPVNVNIL